MANAPVFSVANLKAFVGSVVYSNPYQGNILSSGIPSCGDPGLELLFYKVTKKLQCIGFLYHLTFKLFWTRSGVHSVVSEC